MKVTALKQCDAWEPVSRGEHPLAGKRALFPGHTYRLADAAVFSAVPEMTPGRAARQPGKQVGIEQAAKDGLVKRLSERGVA